MGSDGDVELIVGGEAGVARRKGLGNKKKLRLGMVLFVRRGVSTGTWAGRFTTREKMVDIVIVTIMITPLT